MKYLGHLSQKEEVIMAKSPVAQTTASKGPLGADELRKIDAYWRATLYLCVGMIFLKPRGQAGLTRP